MRKTKTFEAYLDQYHTISVYLKKSFYNGVSSTFRLKDEQSNSVNLKIVDKHEDEDYIKYLVEVQDLKFGENYRIADDHNLVCPLQYGYVVRTPEFDEEFYYDGEDLGLT